GDDDVQPHLGDEVDGVLRASVDLGVALLTAVAADLADGQALHTEGLQRLLDVVELERLDHRGDQLHPCTAPPEVDRLDPAPGGPGSSTVPADAAARWPGENAPLATPPKS